MLGELLRNWTRGLLIRNGIIDERLYLAINGMEIYQLKSINRSGVINGGWDCYPYALEFS